MWKIWPSSCKICVSGSGGEGELPKNRHRSGEEEGHLHSWVLPSPSYRRWNFQLGDFESEMENVRAINSIHLMRPNNGSPSEALTRRVDNLLTFSTLFSIVPAKSRDTLWSHQVAGFAVPTVSCHNLSKSIFSFSKSSRIFFAADSCFSGPNPLGELASYCTVSTHL